MRAAEALIDELLDQRQVARQEALFALWRARLWQEICGHYRLDSGSRGGLPRAFGRCTAALRPIFEGWAEDAQAVDLLDHMKTPAEGIPGRIYSVQTSAMGSAHGPAL